MAQATPIDANAPSDALKSAGELPVTMSARAAKRISEIVGGESSPKVLRLAVLGGGCSGFSYEFGLEDAAGPDDLVIARDGAQMVVDIVSLPYLEGSEVDFVDDLIGQSFQVKNPNATASCGCGTSFSI